MSIYDNPFCALFLCLFFIFSEDETTEAETIALKISSFVEAHDIDIDLPVDTKNAGASCLDVKISRNIPMNGESPKVDDLMSNEPFKNGLEGHVECSKSDRKCHVDNHATDHNYACSGFPMRKALPLKPEVNGCSVVNGSSSTDSPKKAALPDLKQESEKKNSNGTEMNHTRKRRLSCDKNSPEKEKILPKRYRGPYCEDNSKDHTCSSSDEDDHYSRSGSRRRSSSDEHSDHKRMQRNGKYRSSSDEGNNYYKRSNRRHSLYSNDSSDDRDYSSSDEDSKNERRRRYDPRSSESDLHRKRSSGSERDSDSYRSRHRRKQRSRSKDRLEKRNDEKKNKKFQDIELERKMGFKFDHNIKGTAKVQ